MQFYLLPATLYHKVDSGVQKIREDAVNPSQSETPKPLQMQMGLSSLPEPLQEIAKVRLDHPDMPLKDLGQLLNPPVGKSGVNHRLRRISEIAEKLRK